MTLQRVESVTTFTNDNQVTTTTRGRHSSTHTSYIDEDRGYSTVPRNSPNKLSPDACYSDFSRLAKTVSQDPICRTESQQSFLRTASTKAIPSPSIDDLRHSHSRDFQNDDTRHHHSQQKRSHNHNQPRPISNAVSSPAFNLDYNHSNSCKTPTGTHDTNGESSSSSKHRRYHNRHPHPPHHHHHPSNNDLLSTSDCPKSRYRKHETSTSKYDGRSGNNRIPPHHHQNREQVVDFPKVKKAHSESALYADNSNHLYDDDDDDDYHHQRQYNKERPIRRNHSTHSSSRPDCNGTPLTPTHTNTTATTTAAIANNSDNGRRRYHRRYSSSPDSPKQPKACALSYVFPWSQRNKNSRRRQRSPPRQLQGPPSSPTRDRSRRRLDLQLGGEPINIVQTTPSQNQKRLSTTRPLSVAPPKTLAINNNKEHASHPSPNSEIPPTPKSAPVRTPFRITNPIPNPFESTEDFPISPKSAPAFQFDITPADDDDEERSGEEEEEEENRHRRHYQPHRHPYKSSHQQPNNKLSRSRSEQRYKSLSTRVVVRDKSEDAFNRDSDSEDRNSAQKSLGDSRKSLRDSNNHLFTSNSNNQISRSRSNHSSTYNRDRDRERERDNHRTVSSSGTTSEKAKSKQSNSNSLSKSRPSRTECQGIEEDSQCQNTEESSTDCSARKIRRAGVKPVDLDPKIDSFGRYVSEADKIVINDEEDFEYRPTDMKGPLHISFCGCGFLGMYHLGVVSSLIQRGPSFLERMQKFAGASAGALMAALLVTAPERAEESVVYFHHLSKEIRSKPLGALTPGYSLAKSLRHMLDDFLPEDAHLEASGRLFISLTNGSTKKNEIWSQFESREELLQVLLASCYIPIYAGSKLPTIRGKRYMDGGLTNNMIQFNTGRTITVSPFDGKSDIGPKAGQEASKKAHFVNFHNQNIQMNMQNLKRGAHAFFPPRRAVLQEYFDKGRLDASRFLIKEGLYEIDVLQQPQTIVYESSV